MVEAFVEGGEGLEGVCHGDVEAPRGHGDEGGELGACQWSCTFLWGDRVMWDAYHEEVQLENVRLIPPALLRDIVVQGLLDRGTTVKISSGHCTVAGLEAIADS
jgi:hypothetical protein